MRTNDRINAAVRVKGDALGKVEVPLEHLWGAQTERSRHNFPTGVERYRWGRPVIRALGILKKCAALTKEELGQLPHQIYEFRFSRYAGPVENCRIACPKGAYVDTLAHDLGGKLGCGAHLATLRCVASGRFSVADAATFKEMLKMSTSELQKRVIPYLKLAQASLSG